MQESLDMGMNHQKIDIGTAYDAALLGKIAKVQGNARTVHNLVYSAVCVLLVVLGLQAGYETARGIILIAAGCILLPLSNYSVRRKARDEVEELGGKRKLARYQFEDQKIIASIGQSREEIQYDQIHSLKEDDKGYYLFYGRTGAIYVSRQSLKNIGSENFKVLVEEWTGRKFKKPGSVLTFNIHDLISLLRK